MTTEGFVRWLGGQREMGMTASGWNEHRQSLIGFGNWCRKTGRLIASPFGDLPTQDATPNRKPLALTEDQLRRLLYVARHRPLAEHGRETARCNDDDGPQSNRSRRTWTKAPLTLDTIDAAAQRARVVLARRPGRVGELESLGRERALIYKTLTLTGLRKAELASLTVGQLELDDTTAYAVLDAKDEKAGRGGGHPAQSRLGR